MTAPSDGAPAGAVDYLVNSFLPDKAALWDRSIVDQKIPLKVRRADDGFATAADMAARMDELGFATLLVPTISDRHAAQHAASVETRLVDFEDIAASLTDLDTMAASHPGRFYGLWCVDPTHGLAAVREAEEVLARPWIAGMYLHVHSFDKPLDHADFYPWYDLADRQSVPVVMQVGASGGRMPSECGRPIGIDRPAIYFPDTRFVLSHTGWPWVDEAIAMALKFSNCYLGTGSWPPDRWAPAMVDFLKYAGRRKVVFGTNFPTVGHRHALQRLERLDLEPDIRQALMSDNARSVFTRLGHPTSPTPTTNGGPR